MADRCAPAARGAEVLSHIPLSLLDSLFETHFSLMRTRSAVWCWDEFGFINWVYRFVLNLPGAQKENLGVNGAA